ncbi:hypothetical protein [Agrobacterium rubi]|uniref:Ribbon-helix-helix protein CopG domain-containing protein n=1 Tax=Agrobacterium rubi TaxID=28099 RepID=A0ABX2J1W6_9HYPH|nr:hypothetical protein [Agrobacterium rubi]NTF35530.1 hypothetical protein [Agrobacterium rubi]
MEKEPTDQRVPLMMEASLLEKVDEYRLSKRIWSRGKAIRQLIDRGLEAEMKTATE